MVITPFTEVKTGLNVSMYTLQWEKYLLYFISSLKVL